MMDRLPWLWSVVQRHRHTGRDGSSPIPTEGLEDGAVTTPKLANSSVTSAKILDGTIATTDLANGIIVPDKVGPMCYARLRRHTSYLSLPASTAVKVPFEAAIFDTTGGAWSSAYPTRFAIKRAGKWLFTAHMTFETTGPAATHFAIVLRHNNANAFAVEGTYGDVGNIRRDLNVAAIWECALNDFVEAEVFVNASGWVMTAHLYWGGELRGTWLGQ